MAVEHDICYEIYGNDGTSLSMYAPEAFDEGRDTSSSFLRAAYEFCRECGEPDALARRNAYDMAGSKPNHVDEDGEDWYVLPDARSST